MGKAPQLYRNVNSLGMRKVQEMRGIFGKVYASESRTRSCRLHVLLFCYAGGRLLQAIYPHGGQSLNVSESTDGETKTT